MSIHEELRAKLKEAMKAKDLRTANVIRMIEAKVTDRRTAKGFKGQVDDALYLDVIASYKKSLVKAMGQYEAAGERGKAQVEQLRWEIEFCDQLLPQPMSDDELRQVVEKAIEAQGITEPKMAGRVVGAVMKEHKGEVEPARVKALAEAMLSGSA